MSLFFLRVEYFSFYEREVIIMIDSVQMGNIIKERRKELGFTQTDVAKVLGISKRAYIDFEKGRTIFRSKERYIKLIYFALCTYHFQTQIAYK